MLLPSWFRKPRIANYVVIMDIRVFTFIFVDLENHKKVFLLPALLALE